MTAYYREDRKHWYAQFTVTLPDGSKKFFREKPNVNTREGAEKFERDRRKELDAAPATPLAPVPTLAEFAPAFLTFAQNNTKRSTHAETVSVMRDHLMPFFGGLLLTAITSEKIEEYKAQVRSVRYRKNLAKKTVNNHLIVLSRLLHLAAEWKRLGGAALPKLRQYPQVPLADREFEFLTFEEMPRFIAAAQGTRVEAAVVLALHTGLRIGELRALKWENIDLTAGRLRVRERLWQTDDTDTPKGGRGREIPLNATAREALGAIRHLKGPYVFCDEKGVPYTYAIYNNALQGISRRAAVGRNITCHDLRHTFASHLAMKGVPLRVIQELLGHATIEMTAIYAHLAPHIMADAVLVLDGPAAAGGVK